LPTAVVEGVAVADEVGVGRRDERTERARRLTLGQSNSELGATT